MGGGSSTPSETTQTVKQEPLPEVRKWVDPLMNRAADLSNRPYEPYTADRIAGFSPEQSLGMDMTTQRALSGSPVNAAAQGGIQNILNTSYQGQMNPFLGQQTQVANNPYFGPNPYFENALSRTLQNTQGAVNKQFFGDAWGGSGHQQNLARELGNTENAMRMQDYANQQQLGEAAANRYTNASATDLARNLGGAEAMFGRWDTGANNLMSKQLGAAGLAPQLAAQDYTDLQALMGIGDVKQQYMQDLLNTAYTDWREQQAWPVQNYSILANTLGSMFGAGGTSQSTGTQTLPGSSKTAGALGGAASGAAMGSMIYPGIGTAIGAIAGGLLGSRT